MSVPELIKGYVGESEKALAKIFATARQESPAVIFLDEIESMFSSEGDLSSKVAQC